MAYDRRRRSHNQRLEELPDDDAFVEAVKVLYADLRRYGNGVRADDVAWKLGVTGANRLGNGAVKGTWSGRMSGSLRVSPRLRSLVKQGRLRSFHDEHSRWRYYPAEGER